MSDTSETAGIESESVHNELYRMWTRFNDEAMDYIGGQTINERLYWFGLLGQFDWCRSDDERGAFYFKLFASKFYTEERPGQATFLVRRSRGYGRDESAKSHEAGVCG